MFELDTLLFDLVIPGDKLPSEDALTALLGADLGGRAVLDVDVDFPQYEMQISPSVPLRRRGERRFLIVDAARGPLRKDPQEQPIVPLDLRPERDLLIALVHDLGARVGRMATLGVWGDAAVVVRKPRDLRAWALLLWALDPTMDQDGRRRANPLSRQEFEQKLLSFDKRLDEIDDASVLGLVPPASIAPGPDGLWVVDCLSDRDGSWDVRKSLELETRVGAQAHFAHIPGAPVTLPIGSTSALPDSVTKALGQVAAAKVNGSQANGNSTAAPHAPTPMPAQAGAPLAPTPPPAVEPPRPPAAPILANDVAGRVILRIPQERFGLDLVTALGTRINEVLDPTDPISNEIRSRIASDGCGFVAPLAFLSEVFVEGKPLSKPQFEQGAQSVAPGVRAFDAHLPRFGPVRILETPQGRFITSELESGPGDSLRALLG